MQIYGKMSEINEKLNRICIEHRVHEVTETHSGIIEFWDRMPKDKKIGIRGAGRHSVEMFQLIRYWEYNIVGFFDEDKQYEDYLPYPVYDVAQICEHNIDIMFLSSHPHRFEMMDEIILEHPEIQCADMYEFFRLEKNKMFINSFHDEYFFDEMYQENNRPFINKNEEMLLKIYYARKHINEKYRGEKWLACNLKILISCYLKIKDFRNAFECIEKITGGGHEEYQGYIEFQAELQVFLNRIKKQILSKKEHNESILFLHIDAFSYKDFGDRKESRMEYLHELAEKRGIIFENAYSPGIYTSEVLKSIFSGQKIHSANFHELDMMGKDNFVLRELQKNGYRIKVFGSYDLYAKFRKSHERQISELFWRLICDLHETNRKTFYFVREVDLIHTPVRCPEQSTPPIRWDAKRKISDRVRLLECCKYLDKTMRYYFQYLHSDMTKVIFGDHGHLEAIFNWSKYKFWEDIQIHVVLIVIAGNFKPKRVKELYSTEFLGDLLTDVIYRSPEISLRNIEFAEVQLDLFRNAYILKRHRIEGGRYAFIPFKVFVTLEDKYVITYAGQEFYYVMPDEKTNLIDHPDCQERISYIKSKNDLSFPDFKHPIYADTYRFYFDESDRPTQLLKD